MTIYVETPKTLKINNNKSLSGLPHSEERSKYINIRCSRLQIKENFGDTKRQYITIKKFHSSKKT